MNPMRQGVYALGLLLLLWFLASLFTRRDPLSLIKNVSGPDQDQEMRVSYDTLLSQNKVLREQLGEVQEQLAICRGQKQYKRGLIDIESNTVNMRSEASLSSDIIMQIPDSSVIQILYYDTNRYILNDKYGKWCRVRYAETDGWIWGNFIKELD